MPVIITGDIISSSKLALPKRQQQLNELLRGLFTDLRGIWRRKELLRAETIQGDSFQIYLLDDKEAIRAALLIKCFCLSQSKVGSTYRFNCRLSIAIGAVTLLHPSSLAKSGGLAFDYSGRGLKAISRTGSQLVFESIEIAWTQAINMGLALADELLSRCTPAQNQAVLLKLFYPQQTQEWLAGQIGIGRSAYSQRLKQTGWTALEMLLTYYTDTVKS
ncbi:hypothetical protein [uncultured Hymenobacter sp.]|uniref:hypothetical protein n=1 Tax=uncultured Hymenobacter sp. TaxID=170016 RepID=UPI0035CAF552